MARQHGRDVRASSRGGRGVDGSADGGPNPGDGVDAGGSGTTNDPAKPGSPANDNDPSNASPDATGESGCAIHGRPGSTRVAAGIGLAAVILLARRKRRATA